MVSNETEIPCFDLIYSESMVVLWLWEKRTLVGKTRGLMLFLQPRLALSGQRDFAIGKSEELRH